MLAGGIFNRDTALRAAMLGADAIQIGTAYLATREIVATGALSRLYQRVILNAAPGATARPAKSIGLRVRSLKTPKMEAILALERRFVSGNENESAFLVAVGIPQRQESADRLPGQGSTRRGLDG